MRPESRSYNSYSSYSGSNSSKGTSQYRYILEKGSRKHDCPECTKKRFVRYVDTDFDEYLPDEYGRCDREISCGYHLNPYEDGYERKIGEEELMKLLSTGSPNRKVESGKILNYENTFVPKRVLKSTLRGYENNIFIQNLLLNVPFPFTVEDIERVVALYYLGTVGERGAISFPFIDADHNVRAIQVKHFDRFNHTTNTTFIHSIIERRYKRMDRKIPSWLADYKKNKGFVTCLFGEHLLHKYPNNPIALVEAPKTAVYGTLYFGFPEVIQNFLWIAVYNLSSINLEKCKALQGRLVYLFPDLSEGGKAYNLWKRKAIELEKQIPGTRLIVSDFLEKNADEDARIQGFDLADYLIQEDWRNFRVSG